MSKTIATETPVTDAINDEQLNTVSGGTNALQQLEGDLGKLGTGVPDSNNPISGNGVMIIHTTPYEMPLHRGLPTRR